MRLIAGISALFSSFASVALMVAAVSLSTPVFSQQATVADPSTQTVPVSGAVALPATIPPQASAPAPTPPTGTFVTVKDGSATISGGSLIGEIILWAALLIGAPLAGLVVSLIVKLLGKVGIDVSDADRARLKEFVENGVALAAQRANAELKDKLPVDVQNRVAVDALKYVQDHGADTLKRLGFDPNDPKALEAIQARIAKLLADKTASVGTVNITQS